MKRTTSLCFTKDGIINPAALRYIRENPEVNTIVLFGDGSKEALHHICDFQTDPVLAQPKIRRLGVGITPKYDLRVLHGDGSVSKPHYVFDEDIKAKWLCAKVAAPHVQIFLSDFTSQSETQAELDLRQTEAVCYVAHRLWKLLLIAEERLCFPAVVIDRITRWTHKLTRETIDIEVLKKETGFSTLSYNPDTDLLSVKVLDEEFTVKLSVLNEVYGTLVLPFFNNIYGRRLRITVAITGSSGHASDPVDMTYGELGRIVEDMRIYTREKLIDIHNPMDPHDLLAFAKKVKIDDESCIWVESGETLETTVETHIAQLLRGDIDDLDADDIDPSIIPRRLEGQAPVHA